MKYHVVLNRKLNLEDINQDAQAGKRPCHVMWGISQLLGAKVHFPEDEPLVFSDKIRARIIGSPQHWAFARKLSTQVGEDDVIFCLSEDIGVPVATVCGALKKQPKIVVLNTNIERPKGYLALKLFQLRDKTDLWITTSPLHSNFLQRHLSLSPDRIFLFTGQPTDISFFTPGTASPNKQRPIIGSGGLEKRDYITVAAATQDLDVDVNICAFSPDAKALSRSFPRVIPSNMSHRFYDWNDLKQLYRDADVVVVSLLKNNYQAGLSTLLEAMACRRPAVVTQSPGVIQDIINSGGAIGVNEGDAVGMKQAIQRLLDNPKEAEALAQRGYELTLQQYNHQHYIESIVTELTSRYGKPLQPVESVSSEVSQRSQLVR